ncbi:hypothetical protein [Sphingomonas hankookensis]
MGALKNRWQRVGSRAEPHLRRTYLATIAIGGYVALLALLIVLPPMAIVKTGQVDWLGHVGRDHALYLTTVGDVAAGLIIAGTFVLSVAAGGFAKVAFGTKFVGHTLLLIVGALLPFPVIFTVRAIGEIATKIATAPIGDNLTAAGVLLFWALMVNNAAKPLWDEARDRLGKWLGRQADRFVMWFDAQSRQNGTPDDAGEVPALPGSEAQPR